LMVTANAGGGRTGMSSNAMHSAPFLPVGHNGR
jgi:hypothetical protein